MTGPGQQESSPDQQETSARQQDSSSRRRFGGAGGDGDAQSSDKPVSHSSEHIDLSAFAGREVAAAVAAKVRRA